MNIAKNTKQQDGGNFSVQSILFSPNSGCELSIFKFCGRTVRLKVLYYMIAWN
jgi:hypothetical protein